MYLVKMHHLPHAMILRLHMQICYTHIGNDGFFWKLSRRPSWSEGLTSQGEATDIAWSASLGTNYHAGVMNLLPWLGVKNEARSLGLPE